MTAHTATQLNSPQSRSLNLGDVLFISSNMETANQDGVHTQDASPSVSYVDIGGEPFRITPQGITPVGIQVDDALQNRDLLNDNLQSFEYEYIVANFSNDSSGVLPYNNEVVVKQNPVFSDGFIVPSDCIEVDHDNNSAVVTHSFETELPYGTLHYEDGGVTNFASVPIWVLEGTRLELSS